MTKIYFVKLMRPKSASSCDSAHESIKELATQRSDESGSPVPTNIVLSKKELLQKREVSPPKKGLDHHCR